MFETSNSRFFFFYTHAQSVFDPTDRNGPEGDEIPITDKLMWDI